MGGSVKVKICGLTRPVDAALAAEQGAWALGVIFAPESPRRIGVERAAEVLSAAPAGVERIGVFVNAPAGEIAAAVKACGLTAVQLHGEETPEDCRRIRELVDVPLIKAIRVAGPGSLEGVVQFDTDFILLDTYHPERRGGTGEAFDWNLAATLPREVRNRRVILSGGLDPANIVEAVNSLEPFALDVCSGVESAPGLKDPEKLRELFRNLMKENA